MSNYKILELNSKSVDEKVDEPKRPILTFYTFFQLFLTVGILTITVLYYFGIFTKSEQSNTGNIQKSTEILNLSKLTVLNIDENSKTTTPKIEVNYNNTINKVFESNISNLKLTVQTNSQGNIADEFLTYNGNLANFTTFFNSNDFNVRNSFSQPILSYKNRTATIKQLISRKINSVNTTFVNYTNENSTVFVCYNGYSFQNINILIELSFDKSLKTVIYDLFISSTNGSILYEYKNQKKQPSVIWLYNNNTGSNSFEINVTMTLNSSFLSYQDNNEIVNPYEYVNGLSISLLYYTETNSNTKNFSLNFNSTIPKSINPKIYLRFANVDNINTNRVFQLGDSTLINIYKTGVLCNTCSMQCRYFNNRITFFSNRDNINIMVNSDFNKQDPNNCK